MGAEYWAGLATGLGWGVTAGLGVALAVALWPERQQTFPPNEPNVAQPPATNTADFRAFGGNRG